MTGRSRLARAVGFAAIGAALGCGGVFAFGASLPQTHVIAVSRTVAAEPAVVWGRIVAFDRQAEWRSGLAGVARRGDRVEETDAWGDVLAVRIVEEVPERRLVTEIVDQTAFGGTWTISLASAGPGATSVEIREEGLIPSPFVRAIAHLAIDPAQSATRYLDDLERALGASR